MTRKRRRLYTLLLALAGLGVATALVLTAFQDELVFFYSPTDIAANKPAPGRAIRLGGMVEQGSVQKLPDGVTKFRVTDTARTIDVTYKGALPDLFREGQGVVAEGMVASDGKFDARTILAKHDERYMPPEIAKSMSTKNQPAPAKAGGEQQHATGTLLK